MPRRLFASLALVTGLCVALSGQAPRSTDWPQWRGPDRDGVSRDTGLARQWPASGPPVVWSSKAVGPGFGSIAVVGDRVFLQGQRGRDTAVLAVGQVDGRLLWSRVLGPAGDNDRGPGPRGTPTVDGDRLYALSETGELAGVRIADGSVMWQRNILRDFGGRNISWLISESPLVDGNHVIVTPGGRNAGIVALDKMSGKTVWVSKELSDEAGYASCVMADIQGVKTVVTLTSSAAVGVRASDGKLMWRYTRVSNYTANIATPVVQGDLAFFSTSYGSGGALLRLTAQAGEVKAQEVYFTRDMQNHHGGVVLVNGYLYGFNNSILTCLELATGKMMWRHRSVGKGSLAYADGHLYILSEDNVVGLAEATPTGYQERGRFSIEDQGLPSWAYPAVSGGRLYIRNQGVLTAYDVRAR